MGLYLFEIIRLCGQIHAYVHYKCFPHTYNWYNYTNYSAFSATDTAASASDLLTALVQSLLCGWVSLDLFVQTNLRLCVGLKPARPGSLALNALDFKPKDFTSPPSFSRLLRSQSKTTLPLARAITLGAWDVISKLPQTHAHGILAYVYRLHPKGSTYSKNSHAPERAEVPNSIFSAQGH